ncbi:MAG: DUF835 domain-containing protein [Methanomassiliicoccales archaeon]|nr:DUF835 domain-containing protein [Methanomassiliicoccales archaeon]
MKPFYVLPGSSLLDLREELELIEGDVAGETLERFGFRAGMSLVRELDVAAKDLYDFSEILPQLWSETGLSRMVMEEITESEIVITFEESIEASHGRGCDFTRGYLAGIVSALLKTRYRAKERACISTGSPCCVHVLTPVEEVVTPQEIRTTGEASKYVLEEGYSYLIESEDPSIAFEIYVDQITHGKPGMCVVREYPEKLRSRYDLGNSTILWLSYERDIKYAREPTNIPLIYSEIKNFFDSAKCGIVLISGLEYMISQSNFVKVLKFVQLLNENVAITNSILLLPVSPQTLTSRDLKLLERELRVLNPEECRRGQ